MTIGVAIPCYSGHVHYISSLLDNVAGSTRKPDEIVISCSSCDNNRIQYFVYKDIPVRIWYSTERLNQSTNRNRAASLLKTDLISFLDADDLMHPKRIEYLCQAFESRPDISAVYHSYSRDFITKREDPFWDEPELNMLPSRVIKNPNALGLLVESDTSLPIHHAHVTIRNEVMGRVRFNESWDVYRLEDAVYGGDLVANNIPLMYLNNQLSRYIFSG